VVGIKQGTLAGWWQMSRGKRHCKGYDTSSDLQQVT
jgi:hypothetical protein